MTKLNSTPPGGDKLNKVNSSPVKGGGGQSTPVITDGVKTDVSELLNPPSVDEPRLTITEMKKIDDLVKSGKKMTDKCLREFPEKLRGEYLASKLIEDGRGSAVAIHLEKFHGVDHKVLARKLIEIGEGRAVVQNLRNFKGLDHNAIANEFIKTRKGGVVAENLRKFQGLNHIIIANELIKVGKGKHIAANLGKFQGLDQEIAYSLVKMGKWKEVAFYLKSFHGVDHGTLAIALIELGEGDTVAKNLHNFEGLDHIMIANSLIDSGQGKSLAEYLSNFEGLDHGIINHLIELGEGVTVIRSLKRFLQEDQKVAASKLIEKLLGSGGIDSMYLAKELQKQGLSWVVAENLEKFPGIESLYENFHLDNSVGMTLKDYIYLEIVRLKKIRLVEYYRNSYDYDDPMLLPSIDELQLSTRVVSVLKNERIYTLRELVQCTENELLKFPNLGRKCLHDIKVVLASRNLILGRKVEKWIQQYKS